MPDETQEVVTEESEIRPDYLDLSKHSYRPIKRKLENRERKFISWCEQYYYLNRGRFPSINEACVALKYSPVEIKYFMQNTTVLDAFTNRGIDAWKASVDTYLTTEQCATAIVLSNFADTRTIDEKLRDLNINPAQYQGWLQNPTFKGFMVEMANQAIENIHPEAVQSFIKLIRGGDFQAIKYYFELTGYGKNSEVQNIKLVIQRLIESVQRHVKDPAALGHIAMDLNAITSGAIDPNTPVVVELETSTDEDIMKSLQGN